MVQSPCKNICRLDPNANLCLGCGRTKNEIIKWVHYNDKEKSKIIKKASKKKYLQELMLKI